MGCPHIVSLLRLPACVYRTAFHYATFCGRSSPTTSPTSRCPEVHTSYVTWYSPPYLLIRSTTPGQILLASATSPNAPTHTQRFIARRWCSRCYTIMSAFTDCLFDSCQRGVTHCILPSYQFPSSEPLSTTTSESSVQSLVGR